jgi:hypothetical protein
MKQLLSAFLLLFSAYANGQSFSDYIKIYGERAVLQCSVDSVNSTIVYLRRKDAPFYGLGISWKQVQGLYISDTSLKKAVAISGHSKLLVSHPSLLSVTIQGNVRESSVSLTDSLSRVTISYHLERAGINLNAGERLGLLAVLVGGCTVFAKDLNQVKTISGIAAGIGLIGLGVRISGGKHLILAGQKIRYRK